MINGGFTGISTNGGSGSSKVGSAYLVNLIASSVDMAESLRMTKLVLAGLELGGVIGSLLGVAVLLLCVTLFVLAVEEYKANVDNMFAYMSGDESAGDAIAVNAGINIAVTAAFSGTGYLAKNQLAKYAAKQVTDKLGEELAERLLKDGADSTVIAKAIRSLEKSGVDNTLIRKAAAQMTAAEFDRIGALAKRGLAGELLEKVVDNRAVLGKVSDSTLLLLRGSKNSADDIITVLLRHGDEAGRLYGQYGDDVIEVALRYGDEGLEGIRRHGTDFLIEYFAYGDEFVQSYMKNGDKVLELVIKYSDDAMEGIRKYGDGFVVLYKSYGDEFVQNYFKYGDDAVDAYTKYGDNAAKVLESEYKSVVLNKSIQIMIADEKAIEKMTEYIGEMRGKLPSDVKNSGNFAYADVYINNHESRYFASSAIDSLEEYTSLAERVPDISVQPEKIYYDAIEAIGKNGDIYLRDSCSEYKIINDIARVINVNDSGKITIFTELEPCDSCKNIINQFSDEHPDIVIEIIHNDGNRIKAVRK